MKTQILLLLCILTSVNSYSFQEESLLAQLNTSISNSKKVEILLQLADYKISNNANQSVLYAQQALKLSLKEKLDSNIATSYNALAKGYLRKGDYDKVLVLTDSALYFAKKSGFLPAQFAAFRTKGNAYRRKANYTESLSSYLACLQVAKKLNNFYLLGEAYSSLGVFYSTTNDLVRAQEYHQKSLTAYKKANDKIGMSYSYENIGILYRKEKKYTDALDWYFKSLAIRLEIKDTAEIAFCYNDIGAAYMFLNNHNKADQYLKKSINIREAINDREELPYTYYYLGQNKENKKDYKLAEFYYKKSMNIAFELGNNKQIIESQQDISGFYSRIHNPDSAYHYLKKVTTFKDSINRIANNDLVNELTIKYETSEKDKLIKEQQWLITRRTYTIITILIAIVILGIIIYLVLHRKKLQQKNQQQEQLTKAIVEAEESERKRIASDLHDGVGQLFSAVKMNLSGLLNRIEIKKDEDLFLAEKTMALVDESCKEVRVISHKMMPNFLLKSGIAADIKSFIEKLDEKKLKISFESVGFKEQLEFNEEIILYRVIQELIGNVIKHANANELHISLNKTKENIQVKIVDNGIGFDYDKAIEKGGLGLKNILVRIEYLKGKVHFSNHLPTGTSVQIDIPIS